MAIKPITANYPSGYYLDPAYDGLRIGASANVSGPGVTTTSSHPSNVANLGGVQGAAQGILLADGGRVVNGSSYDFTAIVSAAGNGIEVQSNPGTIVNSGQIASTSTGGSGVALTAGGTITNGSANNRTAPISGSVGITLDGPGTINNFGHIVSLYANTGGVAVSITSPDGDMLEQGGASVDGAIIGDGGTLRFTANGGLASQVGDVSGFATITADAGASWNVSGTMTLSGPDSLLSNRGSLTNDGHITVAGQLANAGSIVSNTKSSVVVGGETTNSGSIVAEGADASVKFTGSVKNSGAIKSTDNGKSSFEFAGAVANQGSIAGDDDTISFDGRLNNTGKISEDLGFIEINAQVINSGTIEADNARIDLRGDYSIGTNSTGNIDLTYVSLVKTSGVGVSVVQTGSGRFRSIYGGSIAVETGTLELTGKTLQVLCDTGGAGTLEFGPGNATMSFGPGTAAFIISGTGAHVTSPASEVGYYGKFSVIKRGELTLSNPAGQWWLYGSSTFSGATIDGVGQFHTVGPTSLANTTLGGSVQWQNYGVLTETGPFTVAAGHSIAFTNEAQGTFDLAGNVGIIGTGTGGFANDGLLAKTAGGLSTIAIALTNTGTVEVGIGTIDLADAVTGNGGKLQIDSGTFLRADASVGAGQTVLFEGTNDKLILTDAADFHAKLSGFAATDKIDLTQFGAGATLAYSGGASGGTLTVTDGVLQAKLGLLGQYAAAGFHIGTDGNNGSWVTYTPPAAPAVVDPLAAASI